MRELLGTETKERELRRGFFDWQQQLLLQALPFPHLGSAQGSIQRFLAGQSLSQRVADERMVLLRFHGTGGCTQHAHQAAAAWHTLRN